MISMSFIFENFLANVGINTPELTSEFREFNPFAALARIHYIKYRDMIMERNRNILSFINSIRQAKDANIVMSFAEQFRIVKIGVMIDDCMRETCDYKTFTGKAIFETKCENEIRKKLECSLIPIQNLFDDKLPYSTKHYKKPPRFFHHKIDVNDYSLRRIQTRGVKNETIHGKSL